MNKKLIKNTILFTGIAAMPTTACMINTEAKSGHIRINSYNAKSQIVDIPDENLKKGINNALKRGEVLTDITIEDMESLTSLTILSKKISNIEGIQYAININSLNLGANNITDISPLSSMVHLKRLWLDSNKISSVESISTLTNIESLRISANLLTDISPLSNLTNLTDLCLGGNIVKDLSPLGNLKKLNSLKFNGSALTDITVLKNLTNLTDLNLESNQISDISPLSNLTKLTSLHLGRNQISDISSIENLTNLTSLYIYFNKISDVAVLSNFNNLTNLQMQNNLITDISSIKSLIKLTTLYANSNQIDDVSALKNLVNLNTIWLHSNKISNIDSLTDLTSLTTLYLYFNQIEDISALRHLTNLNNLSLNNNKLENISSLENLTKLTTLDISNNQIGDIVAIENLVDLTNLILYGNRICDISPLTKLINLKSLQLSGNPIQDVSPIENLTNLTSLLLNNNKLSDISFLENLTKLKDLQIHTNQIKDISPLHKLTNLTSLFLNSNQISDISALNNLTKLTTLNLAGQKINNDYIFKTNIELTNISVDNLVKGVDGENIGVTSVSNSGRYENGKLYWDNIALGKKTFTSSFSQIVQLGSAKATFSGNITYNIDVVDGEGPIVNNEISVDGEDFTLSATISAEDLLSEVNYLIHRGERHDLPYTFNYDVFNRENNIVQVYDTAGNMTEYEVTADLLDLETINSLMLLLEENDNSPSVISYIRAIINNMSESSNKDLLNDKINNLSFEMTLDRLTTSANVDIYIKCENLLSMTLDTNMITFEDFSGAEDMEKSKAIAITINSSLPYQLNAYLPTEIQNADGTKSLDKSIFNIKESSEDEYKKFTSIGGKVILKDNCEKGNDLVHLIDLKLSSDSSHDADVYKTTIKFEIEQK